MTASTVTVVEAPSCNVVCAPRHPEMSHLSYTVHYLNENRAPFDTILALHMNSADSETATGVEVYYANGASAERKHQAAIVATAVVNALCLPLRGVLRSGDSQHSSLAILDRTAAPAFLIELGFITNQTDVTAVLEHGADAVIAAIEVLHSGEKP